MKVKKAKNQDEHFGGTDFPTQKKAKKVKKPQSLKKIVKNRGVAMPEQQSSQQTLSRKLSQMIGFKQVEDMEVQPSYSTPEVLAKTSNKISLDDWTEKPFELPLKKLIREHNASAFNAYTKEFSG